MTHSAILPHFDVICDLLLRQTHRNMKSICSTNCKVQLKQYIFVNKISDATTEFKFVGINIFWTRHRVVLARAARQGKTVLGVSNGAIQFKRAGKNWPSLVKIR